MAKKAKKTKKAAPKATTKAPRKAARSSAPKKGAKKAGKKGKAKNPNDVRFIMVVEPAFKTKMKAAAKRLSAEEGAHVSMSEWVRRTLAKAV